MFLSLSLSLSLALSPTVALVLFFPQEPLNSLSLPYGGAGDDFSTGAEALSLSLSLGDHLVTDACIA